MAERNKKINCFEAYEFDFNIDNMFGEKAVADALLTKIFFHAKGFRGKIKLKYRVGFLGLER